MQYRKLGNTGIDVSVICLGTMTWGEQNTQVEAFAQMDYALAHGVNFFDTAELYPIPPRAETYGRTEEIIGNWLHKTGNRSRISLASKVAGPGPGWIDHIRNGRTRYNREQLQEALDGSLRRLQTDCIDLYQLHWPERDTNFFGQLGFTPGEPDEFTPVVETLEALNDFVQAGKIRHIGLSNETPWGIMRFIQIAEQLGLPRVVTVQNPYSLLNRSYEVGAAEVSWREHCGLLAYSPLGFGVLSGKYLNGARPAGARLTRFPDYMRYSSPTAERATSQYVALARRHDLEPSQMALAFVNSRRVLTSTIIGATSLEQLRSNIGSIEVELSNEVLEGIEAIHSEQPNPSP
ncbi:MAG: NADP(H)-dependent aldo-keto reductase [Gammaproteobacteria bacterium]|nr:NADP(H)-dependent aldo-keto reductase [Gammaproteobacteria bacterium]MDH3559618.1 NADP(H)-dependent aldo-keto reductase [Gammaproteobacteria bacterium]